MKKNIIILFVFLFGITNTSIAQSKSMDEFTLQVEGLGCPFCAYGLEKKFKELKGIKKIDIKMETGMMVFLYPSDKNLKIDEASKQVEKAGYTPVYISVKRADGSQESTKSENDKKETSDNMHKVSFFVAGNCDMCKARIEKAAKELVGVGNAIWNKDTRQITVEIDPSKTNQYQIESAIAKVGHDTEEEKAENKIYHNLPGCCHYKRD